MSLPVRSVNASGPLVSASLGSHGSTCAKVCGGKRHNRTVMPCSRQRFDAAEVIATASAESPNQSLTLDILRGAPHYPEVAVKDTREPVRSTRIVFLFRNPELRGLPEGEYSR